MKKFSTIIIIFILIINLLSGCKNNEPSTLSTNSDKIQVAVSIIPQETFVKKVGGDLVDVVTLIPAGASPSNYQPSPKEMSKLSEASLYFNIGVNAETNILQSLNNINSDIKIVDLSKMVDEKYPARYFEDEHEHEEDEHEHEEDEHEHEEDEHEHEEDEHEHEEDEHEHEEDEHDHVHEGRDPHIWMSPKRVIVIIESIRDELINIDPENRDIYTENASAYIQELKVIDEEVKATMEQLTEKTFIILHPSMGYFADDYGLKMVAIEEDGKETTATRLQEIIELAKENNIKVVFYQAEFDNQQAETIASEIGGETMELQPLSDDYINNLKEINEVFQNVLQ